MEPTGRSVKLPEHIWRALDDMSKDGAQQPDLLVRHAVEAFVALQGYELPAVPRAQPPQPPQPKTEHVERPASAFAPVPSPAPKAAPAPKKPAVKPAPAPTPAAKPAAPAPAPAPVAKASPAPAAKPAPPVPPVPTPASEAKTGALEPYGSVTEPVPKQKVAAAAAVTSQSYDEEDDMGEGMTRVRMGPASAPDGLTDPGLGAAPVVTDTRAVHEPSAPPVADDSTVHGEAEGPEWVKRAALLDTDSDRTAARERMQAIDSDLGRLTLERPTTTPLGEAHGEGDGDGEEDGDDSEAPEADADDVGDA